MPMSPSTVRAITRLASPDHTRRSADTSVTSSGTSYLPCCRWACPEGLAVRAAGRGRPRRGRGCCRLPPVCTVPPLARAPAGTRSLGGARGATGGATHLRAGQGAMHERARAPRGRPGRHHASAQLLLDLLGLALDVLEAAAHEEGLLGGVVVVTIRDLGERLDRLAQGDERPLETGEVLRHEGVLGQEALDPAGAVDRDPVFLRELLDA